jgi:hypothetical protein
MFGKGVRYESIAPCLSEVESFSLIRYDDGYFLAGPAAAPDMYFCSWMFVVAVHDGVGQSLSERHFNIELLARGTLRSFNQHHQAFH